MRIRKIALVIAILFSVLSYAQESVYIVLDKNDTVYGDKIRFKSKGIVLKKGKNKTLYNISQIKGYSYKPRFERYSYYEKVLSPFYMDNHIPGKMTFIKRLTKEGRIKLYYGGYINGIKSPPYLYISKDKGRLIELSTGGGLARIKFARKSTYKELIPFVKDNSEILTELETIKPTEDAFVKLINKYNESFE